MNIDSDDLYKWIDEHTITRQKRNLNRDFADAVPLAEILKHHFPKLVDLHNYGPKNSLSHKLTNWDIINKRVLCKIGITLSSNDMDKLARGTPGAIENLLGNIKSRVENKASGDHGGNTSSRVYYLENASNFSSKEGIVPIKIKNGTKTVDRKMVPNEIFDKMEKDIAEKEEAIGTLTGKIEHLENLIAVKDERIKDLTKQLQSLVNGSSDQASVVSPKSRFFNKIF